MHNDVLTHGMKQRAAELLASNQLPQARDLLQQVCQADPRDVQSWIYLVQINAQLGQPAEVERCCRAIIEVLPNSDDAYYHFGSALLLQNKFEEAEAAFRHVLQLKPNHPMAIFHLGKTLRFMDRFAEALRCFKQTVQLTPNLAEAYDALGGMLLHFCQIDAAVAAYQQALRLQPDFDKTRSDMLFAMNYRPRYDPAVIFSEHVRWGTVHKLKTQFSVPHKNPPDINRKLRIGYISPDLCTHSVSFFFEPLLANHNHTHFEIFCYADIAKPDATTIRLQSNTDHWRQIHGVSDQQVAEQIQADGIDILVDLAGHTARSRLLALTAKPAPVQVTYLGYPNTTGVPAMDYRLTDAWADPPGTTDRYYTETLVRLPHGFLCYLPPVDAPVVSPPPAAHQGNVTFGSFNNLAKVTPQVVSLWASILNAIPGSRLIMKCSLFDELAMRESYLGLFAGHGVSADRLDLLPRIDATTGHLALYGKVDIALDTFPYNGTTTTCEALWMGVPVITLAGHLHAGRVGVSLLTQIGHTELIAETPDDYRRIATELANDNHKLFTLRSSLRGQIGTSRLCNGKAFATDVECAYREMWRIWCGNQRTAV